MRNQSQAGEICTLSAVEDPKGSVSKVNIRVVIIDRGTKLWRERCECETSYFLVRQRQEIQSH